MKKTVPFFKSISFIIPVFFAALIALTSILIGIFNSEYIKERLVGFYKNKGYILSCETENIIIVKGNLKTIDDLDEGSMEYYIQQTFQKHKDLMGMYLEELSPDRTKGRIHYSVEWSEDNPEEMKERRHTQWVDLSEDEKKLVDGIEEYVVDTQGGESNNLLTIKHGVKDASDTVVAILGTNFSVKDLQKQFIKAAHAPTLILYLSYGAALIVVIIVVRKMLIKPVLLIGSHMRKFVGADVIEKDNIFIKGKNELTQMADNYNAITEKINDYVEELTIASKERQAKEAQMQVAAQIQKGLLPPGFYMDDNLRIDTLMHPAKFIGGDFYDYFGLGDSKMCFLIADVSGKGTSAAMFMSSAITMIRYNLLRCKSPADALTAVNKDIIENTGRKLFASCVLAVYDSTDSSLTYACAGNYYPYLVGEGIERLDGNPGAYLGEFENSVYEEKQVFIKERDVLYMCSDGVERAVNENEEQFGIERLETALIQARALSPEICSRVYEEIVSFRGEAEQNDDITMLAVTFKNMWSLKLEAKTTEIKRLKPFFLENESIPKDLRKKLYIAAEEIFVNIASYAYDVSKDTDLLPSDPDFGAMVELYIVDGLLHMIFTDAGKPYNPLDKVITAEEYMDEMTIGGLGKMMAFQIVDDVEYKYRDGKNILMMTKKIN